MTKRARNGLSGAMMLLTSLCIAARAQAQSEKPKAATQATAAATVPMPTSDRMPMAQFKSLLARGEVVVLDVRSNGAYVDSHIPGALSVPLETIDATLAEKLKQMGKPVATYCSCQAEHTAALAAQTLQKMGVPAQAVVGGFNQWNQEKNPLKKGPDAK